jgi:hypothetical protein
MAIEETQHDPLTSIIGAGGQGAKRQNPSRRRMGRRWSTLLQLGELLTPLSGHARP